MIAWQVICALGAAGGLVNSLLVNQNVLLIPWLNKPSGQRWSVDLGILANAIIGAAAAVITESLGGVAALDSQHQIGMCLLAGLGGGNLLTSLVQRFSGDLTSEKTDSLEKLLEQLKDKLP